MRNKILMFAGAVILLVGAAFAVSRYLVSRLNGRGPVILPAAATSSAPETAAESVADWKTYISPSAGLRFQYPPSLKLTEGDAQAAWRVDSQDPGTVVATVALPDSFEPGTNLIGAHFRVGMSSDAKAVADCYAPGGSAAAKKGTPVALNGTSFTFFRESDAGAGNFYDTSSYRTLRGGTCYAVELTVHSTNLGNYPEEQHRAQFDNAKVQEVLLGIFKTLKFL